MFKRVVKIWEKHQKLCFVILIILVMLLGIFGTKILLFFNFLVGNDIAVKLKTDKEWLTLVHNEPQELRFESSISTNPFCKASCTSLFEDISQGILLNEEEFFIRPSIPVQRVYTITAPTKGTGIKMYRYSLSCESQPTALCHTSGEPTTRSILVTVEYDLTPSEKELQERLHSDLEKVMLDISRLRQEQILLAPYLDMLTSKINISLLLQNITATNVTLHLMEEELPAALEQWNAQNLELLEVIVTNLQNNVVILTKESSEMMKVANTTIFRYNNISNELNDIKEELSFFSSLQLQDARLLLNQSFAYNAVVEALPLQSIEMAEQNVLAIRRNLTSLKLLQRFTALSLEIEQDIISDILCELGQECQLHPNVYQRTHEFFINVTSICSSATQWQHTLVALNDSLRPEFIAENYSSDPQFWREIEEMNENLKEKVKRGYLRALSNQTINGSQTQILREILTSSQNLTFENTSENHLKKYFEDSAYNLTPALVSRLMVTPCVENQTRPELRKFNWTALPLVEINTKPTVVALPEPLPQCCVFGKCKSCCINDNCKEDIATYPVVFVHGHAISKDTSFEYSLEGFNKIQQKLEEEGYLSAGSITLYTSRNVPEGLWGKMGVPLTIRASYYFDLFQEPENYVVVQSKSENIDTYAVRLKEVIETIKYKTGKSKVNLVAFSMGGLVSRRYMQIFGGSDVYKLVMIGTPNHGIEGYTLGYCSLTGEEQECRDMNAQSLFMNKLNRDSLPRIPIYNIVGTGCEMSGGQGDGAVLQESAYLEGATNFIINGSCESVAKPLHLTLRDIDKYPKVYEIVKEVLRVK